jgi:hypothetical protein
MQTDLTGQEVFFLSTCYAGYNIDDNSFYTLEGITNIGEYYEEFYPDNDALVELMLDVFYEEVRTDF